MTNEKLKQCLIENTPVVLTTADGDKLHGTLFSIRYTKGENGIRVSVEIADHMKRLIVGDPKNLEEYNA